MARWSELTDRGDEVWLPGNLTIELFNVIMFPRNGVFQPYTENGEPVLRSGRQIPNVDLCERREYKINTTVVEFTDVTINGPIPQGLCNDQFPPGTIVQDRANGEIYQLTGVSPAIGTAMKETLSRMPPKRKRSWINIWTVGIAGLVVVGVGFVIWRKYS